MDTVLAVVAVVVGVLALVYIAWTLIQPWRFLECSRSRKLAY